MGVADTAEQVTKKFEEHKARFRTEEAFKQYLERSNNTPANMMDDLKRNLLRDRVVEKLSGAVDVKDDDVKKYYEENKTRFVEREQVRASRILVRVPFNAAAAESKKGEAKAKALLKQAKAKGADFAKLAKENSGGPEAARGGDLGWFTRGRFPPEFDQAAFALDANQLSGVVKTKLGYEVIRVAEKKPERQRPVEEVKENIRNSLMARKRNEKRREVLRTLKGEAKVEQLITFDRPTPQAVKPTAANPQAKIPATGAAKPVAQPPAAAPEAKPADDTATKTQ
jgi:parvulin-like peptidyl-prolyl isomerase